VARTKTMPVPEVGGEAPEFNLPSAQGGQLRLDIRTARGPVVVVFFRGAWSEEDVEYFKALSAKEDEINHAGASVVGIGVVEPDEARDFVRASGIKSYVLYDYARITGRQWGVLEKDKERGEYARPAAFIVGTDHKIARAWVGDRPAPGEILAKVSEITGLPKPAEEAPETPEQEDAAAGGEKPKKMSAEERERIKAERRAAREAGESVKSPQPGGAASERAAEQTDKPKKMSAEERERIKTERRAAREAGRSLKQPASEPEGAVASETPTGDGAEKPKKMSAEERERIKAERRAAREAGKSLKKPPSGEGTDAETGDQEAGDQEAVQSAETTEAPEAESEEPQEGSRNKVREE
jgi:peroxiredoxin